MIELMAINMAERNNDLKYLNDIQPIDMSSEDLMNLMGLRPQPIRELPEIEELIKSIYDSVDLSTEIASIDTNIYELINNSSLDELIERLIDLKKFNQEGYELRFQTSEDNSIISLVRVKKNV